MTMTLAAGLDTALKAAGIPIVGVSIGSSADRATWAVQFLPNATAQQQTQAAGIVATFDPVDPAVVSAQLDVEAATVYDMNRLFKAKVVSDLAFRLSKAPGALTSAEIAAERTRILNIYKSLP